MAFKAVFLAHALDAEPEKHRSVIETSKYKLFSVVKQLKSAKSLSKRREFSQSYFAQDLHTEMLRR